MEYYRIAIDMGIAVLSWIVQLIIYPAFYYIDPEKFRDWHAQYTGRITMIVFPLMTLQLIFAIISVLDNELWSVPLLTLVIFTWINTFFHAMPIHYKISTSNNHLQIRNLIRANSIRTACWSIIVILDLWIAYS